MIILNPYAQKISIGDIQVTPNGVDVLLTRPEPVNLDGTGMHFATLSLGIQDLSAIGELITGAIQTIRHTRAQMAPSSPLNQ